MFHQIRTKSEAKRIEAGRIDRSDPIRSESGIQTARACARAVSCVLGKSISRVLYSTIIYLRPAVADRLMRPTNRAAAGNRFLRPTWPCSGWGLHGRYVTIPPVSSYLTISTLPQRGDEPRLFRRNVSVALSLRLPSPDVIRHPCPMEPGLSSCCPRFSPKR